jgi:hypothetical protein
MKEIHGVKVLSPDIFEMKVECEGHEHTIAIVGGKMKLRDHDMATLRAFCAFDAAPPPCYELFRMWERSPADLLRVLSLLPPELEGVYNYLSASTGHITEADSQILTDLEDDSLFIHKEFGWWVWVDVVDPDVQEDDLRRLGFSDSFLKLVRYASDSHCYYINLDCDGATIAALPYHEW